MAALPETGTVFAGKYVIESQLGAGAAGVVFSATHRELRQRVAIKVLREGQPVAVERMIREARAALALQSEHVVRVMDVGRDRGLVFLVMEQLEGADLASTLQQRGPLPVAEAVDCVLHACAGVAEAHARGVVHRDLKPSNLFLTRRSDGSPLVKVLDFGISKTNDGQDVEASLTGPAQVLGSPMYMSPEQVRGAKLVDHRTDIWALGVILFRLLTAKAPFGAGMTVGSALASIVADEPASLRELLPDVPRELEAIVARCLAKSPDQRFQSVADVATALAPLGSEDGRAAVVRLVRERVPQRTTRRVWPIAVAFGVAIVAASVVAFATFHRDKTTPADPVAGQPAAVAPPTTTTMAAQPTPSTPASTASIASPPPPSVTPAAVVAPPRRPPVRPRAATNSSVVRSAATDDRY